MAYVKRVPPIKLILTQREYNTLIGVLHKNSEEIDADVNKDLAILTKEKLLKFSIPHEKGSDFIEIEVRLYLNEAADIISQLLLYISNKTKEVDYYQVLAKIRESFANEKNNQ